MAMKLTEGVILMLSTGKLQPADVKPVLQVMDVQVVPSQISSAVGGEQKQERYRLLLSDGSFFQQGMLATQRNELIRSQQLQKGSIVQLKEFVCNSILDRIVLIIIDFDVILENCDFIGDAKPCPVAAVSRTPAISVQLTGGAISMLSSGKWQLITAVKPVLQVLDVKIVQTQGGVAENTERYQLLLSDGSFHQQAMLVILNGVS